MKKCSRCNLILPLDSFSDKFKKGYQEGVFCWCNKCVAEYSKEYRKNKIRVIPDKQVCKICKIEKDAEFFSKCSTNKSGLDSRCKNCYRDLTQQRRGGLNSKTIDNRKLKLKNRFRCRVCNKSKDLEIKSKGNNDSICKPCKNKEARNRPYSPEKRRQDYLNHPIRHKKDRAVRRGRINGAKGFATKEQIQARFDYYGNRCIYCKTTDK